MVPCHSSQYPSKHTKKKLLSKRDITMNADTHTHCIEACTHRVEHVLSDFEQEKYRILWEKYGRRAQDKRLVLQYYAHNTMHNIDSNDNNLQLFTLFAPHSPVLGSIFIFPILLSSQTPKYGIWRGIMNYIIKRILPINYIASMYYVWHDMWYTVKAPLQPQRFYSKF